MPIEDRLDRIEKLLTMIWNQQQVQKHEPVETSKQQVHPRIMQMAQSMVERHHGAKTMLAATASEMLNEMVKTMVNPVGSAEAIDRHHAWRCRYEWATKDPAFIPRLYKWLKEDAFGPCPTEEQGQAMLRQPERMSRTERDLLEMSKEFGA